MTAQEVLKLVRDQIGGRWTDTNWPHGVFLPKCIVDPPIRRKFLNPLDQSKSFDLWVVLEETRDAPRGYCIAYDESEGSFGLGTATTDGAEIFLGFCGDFVSTLESM